MTLKRTTDRLPRARYGERVEFAQGERETDHDRETEQWAAEVFEDLKLVHGDAESENTDEPEDESEDDYEPPERDGSGDERSIEDEAARVVTDMETEHPR